MLLLTNTANQTLIACRHGRPQKTYIVSTSKYGLGGKEGSYKTPVGFHEVVEKIGDGEDSGRIFKGRQPTEKIYHAYMGFADEDLIVTRILRLSGLEEQVNKGPGIDSYNRYIYIHGTNQQHFLGTPASHGCIRMGNDDVIDLFERVRDIPTWCWIGDLFS